MPSYLLELHLNCKKRQTYVRASKAWWATPNIVGANMLGLTPKIEKINLNLFF